MYFEFSNEWAEMNRDYFSFTPFYIEYNNEVCPTVTIAICNFGLVICFDCFYNDKVR